MTKFLSQIEPPTPITEITDDGTVVNPLAKLFVNLWQAAVLFGALLTIIFLIWGSVEWLTSEGDKEKLAGARNKIVNSIIGLVLLAASVAIITFLNRLDLFGFDLLKLAWPTT